MLDQTFSMQNLMGLLTRTDPGKYKLGRTREHYRSAMEAISNQIHDPDFQFSRFSQAIRSGKAVYSTTNSTDEFAIRKLNDNIRRLYNVSQANRSEIMAQVKLLVEEKTPFFVIKIDIKDFYESISREELINQVCDGPYLSYRGKEVLKRLLLGNRIFSEPGLPRGISLSATLSELKMQVFDKKMRATEGVYYYARYVDDIIIFSYSDASSVITKAAQALYPDMRLNAEKTEIVEVNEKGNCVSFSKRPELSYLGYKFEFRLQSIVPPPPPKGKPAPILPPRIKVKIADNKIAKIKKRVILSLLSYVNDNDYGLLFSRMKFLTGNCRMQRKGEAGELLSGIYYNYPLIDEYGRAELKLMSAFLGGSISCNKGSFGLKLNSCMTKLQREDLAKMCFYAGYTKKITQSISAKRLQQIKKCWNHV